MKTGSKIAAAAGIGAGLLTEELYRYIFCRHPYTLFNLLPEGKGHEDQYYEWKKELRKKFDRVPCEKLTMKSERGERLSGFYYPCGSDGKKIVFIVHGYRSDHADTASMFYDYYRSRGIDMFCCDHTAHGDSEGHFIGFDHFETEDCLRWTDLLINRFGADTEIFLHGFSMGAATVMQMSSRCPENVKFIIEDSGYINAYRSLKHQIGSMYCPMRFLNKLAAGYDLDSSDVRASLEKSRVPMLFVHGRDDRLVPYENGPELFNSYRAEKDCLFPGGTRHIETIYTSPEKYAEKVDRFIKLYTK